MLTDRKVSFARAGSTTVLLLLLLWTAGCEPPKESGTKQEESSKFIRYTVKSYLHTIQILDNLGFTREAFEKGMKRIPRVELTRISSRWSREARDIPVEEKKGIFLRLLASGTLQANEEIAKEREKLLRIVRKMSTGPVSRKESAFLRDLAGKYGVIEKRSDPLLPEGVRELIRRVDIVPPSLVVAQGAVESGWGTSRFAVEGNALFGQWSFSETAIRPKEQRRKLGNYGLARFRTPLDSIRAYLKNLNTHAAYRNFRLEREKLRRAGKPLSGTLLAPTLENYSERGEAYVKELLTVIRANNLSWLDRAELDTRAKVIIHPDA